MKTLLILLLVASPVSAEWLLPPVIDKQVLRLRAADANGDGGTCSSAKITLQYAVTAAHCVEGTDVALTVDGKDAKVVKVNRLLDLAVVKFSAIPGAPMPLAPKTPGRGAEIAAVGFAFGSKDLRMQFGHIAAPRDEDGYILLNIDLIFGDSGGPIVDTKGRLVGVSSAIYSNGPAHLGLAVPVESVRDFVEEFMPEPVAKP